jgi:hypothetical protein
MAIVNRNVRIEAMRRLCLQRRLGDGHSSFYNLSRLISLQSPGLQRGEIAMIITIVIKRTYLPFLFGSPPPDLSRFGNST